MKKESVQLLVAFGLSGIALYLLATKSGQNIASEISTGVENMLTARGIRNNNPGNIRLSHTVWQGQLPVAQQTDDTFVQFTAPEYGIRAIAKILDAYAARGIVTVNDIINTWAPPTENDTASYVQTVADSMGVESTASVSKSEYPALIAAIVEHENGSQPYDVSVINKGVEIA